MNENKDILEEEIDLKRYIEVLIKRKKIIISIFLIVVIPTAIFSFFAPRIYEVSLIIEPPKDSQGKYLDTPQNIVKIIKEAYTHRIVEDLNQKILFPLNVTQPRNTTLVKISLKVKESNLKEGKDVLNTIYQFLTQNYKQTVTYKKDMISKKIAGYKKIIQILNETIKEKEGKLNLLGKRKAFLEKEIESVSKNIKRLLRQKDKILKEYNQDITSQFFYTTTIQQMFNYYNQLCSQLENIKAEEKDIILDIKNLKKEMEWEKSELERLKTIKNLISNVRMIQKPGVSFNPVAPKKKLNIAVAGVLGLFLGIFLAFFQEYWEGSNNQKA